MRGKGKYIIGALAAVAVVCAIFLLQPEYTGEAQGERGTSVEISVRLSKDKIIELLDKNGVKLNGKALLASALVPDTLKLIFAPTGDGKNELSEITLNGQKIPHEVLTNISENYLDFSCALVYN